MQRPLFTETPGIKPLKFWGGFRELLDDRSHPPLIYLMPTDQVWRLNRWIYTREYFTMPRRTARNQNSYEPPTFISARLSRDEKEQYKQWVTTVKMDVEAILLEYLADETKVSFSYDAKNDSYICTFTPKGEDHLNASKCLSSRAPTAFTAFMVNVFKDDVLFGKSEWHDLGGDDDIS